MFHFTRFFALFCASTLLAVADEGAFWQLQHRADELLREGQYDQAAPVIQAALAEARALGGGGVPAALSLNNVGYLYAFRGRCDEARTALLSSLEVWKTLGDAGIEGTTYTGSTLVSVYLNCGDPAGAEAFWKRSLERIFAHLSGKTRVYAQLSFIAGTIDLVRRNYARAEQLFAAGLSVMQDQNPSDPDELAMTLNGRAIARIHLSRIEAAAADLQLAIGILEEGHVNDYVGLGKVIGNLAIVYKRTGRFAEAEAAFRRSLGLLDRTYADLSAAEVAHEYAGLLHKTGRKHEASLVEREALALAQNSQRRSLRQTVDLSEFVSRWRGASRVH